MQTITTEQLRQMQSSGERFLLINTLPEDKFNQTRIPGARNIPGDSTEFVRRVEQAAGGKDESIIVYCGNAQCDSSTKAARRLSEAGFTHVLDYEAGAEGWQQGQQAQPAGQSGTKGTQSFGGNA